MLSRRSDAGFTLIELVISISVLGIVMIGLGAVLFGSFASNAQSKLVMDETQDQQFAAAYFGTDAQAANTIHTGIPATCGSGTAVVEFRGSSYEAADVAPPAAGVEPPEVTRTVTVVSYVFSTASVGGSPSGLLRRQSCETGMAQTSTTVANNLSTAVPTSVCPPAPCAQVNALRTSVTMSLVRRSGADPFSLVGTRRTTS